MAGGILLKNLLETVGLIILSMGGAGAIIMSVSSFLANKIATRLEHYALIKSLKPIKQV